MQKRAFKHFRQQETKALSSSFASKLSKFAIIFREKKSPLIKETKATLPGW